MKSVRSKLEGIDDALSKWNKDKASANTHHEFINVELKKVLADDEFPEHLKIKLKELPWHIDSMLGIDDGNGKSFEEHLVWAYGVLMAARI
ncbi:hypothetical protein ACRN9C_20950 [Shewanella frigidimarina]|uniref:hypothetical protein n=1 Tax=Shewanella frigidimarina TaxID=56812 RepID=UPI003D79BD67